MTIGIRIKEQRKKLNIGQDELAKELDIKQTQISRYELGISYPPGDKIEKLCNLLKITPNYLFGFKERLILTENEEQLLELFNSINEEDQKELLGAIKMFIRDNFDTMKEKNQIS